MAKQQLEEPLADYIAAIDLANNAFIGILGGVGLGSIKSDFDVMELTRKGLPKKAIMALAKKISFPIQELARVMHISERTFQRFDEKELVKPEYSEKAIELARLYLKGEEVFGSLERFKTWMKTPSVFFRNETPVSLLDTSIGFSLVKEELGRIEHGIFA
ncbi:antitoxin Xre/MbcA/ParS toxin-binding domain-containing protein [Pseudopedobacter beijingensis]|uniref:Antitoxin Xre/MbcA/ParS toxin-binding domain-containing protein n=1 Tax=Pseudopedobacter beijingensis TaxID=1207056 RepID=A0ABW4I6M2_9SPHI